MIETIFIKGGTFQMGEEGIAIPVHPVTLSDFEIGKYPVTQAEWVKVMGNNPSTSSKACDECPVETVSWNEVQEFLKKLNVQTGKKYRLPTEAEWEYAARGGQSGLNDNFEYAGSNNIDEVAWYYENSGSKTHPVGLKKPNQLGLYDMSGNVWEWCNDWYGDYLAGAKTNPTGPEKGVYRVLRGGSWFFYVNHCRSGIRNWDNGGSRHYNYGFRVACSID